MQLFNTRVIPAAEDTVWLQPILSSEPTELKLLVFSSPFPEKSEESTVLQNMMQACKIGPENYFLKIMETEEKMSLARYCQGKLPPAILMLGVSPRQLGINAQFLLNAGNPFLGSIFIPSLDLGHIAYDKELKRVLWEQGLKPVFGQK